MNMLKIAHFPLKVTESNHDTLLYSCFIFLIIYSSKIKVLNAHGRPGFNCWFVLFQLLWNWVGKKAVWSLNDQFQRDDCPCLIIQARVKKWFIHWSMSQKSYVVVFYMFRRADTAITTPTSFFNINALMASCSIFDLTEQQYPKHR